LCGADDTNHVTCTTADGKIEYYYQLKVKIDVSLTKIGCLLSLNSSELVGAECRRRRAGQLWSSSRIVAKMRFFQQLKCRETAITKVDCSGKTPWVLRKI
jgi:hypothetical protein